MSEVLGIRDLLEILDSARQQCGDCIVKNTVRPAFSNGAKLGGLMPAKLELLPCCLPNPPSHTACANSHSVASLSHVSSPVAVLTVHLSVLRRNDCTFIPVDTMRVRHTPPDLKAVSIPPSGPLCFLVLVMLPADNST